MREVLNAAKSQFINVAICNDEGKWSNEYLSILDIKEFKTSAEKVLVLVLHSANDSRCVAVDASCVHGFKFNKYLSLDGKFIEQITVLSKDAALQVS